MAVGSVLDVGLAGIQRSSRSMQRSAQEIVDVGFGVGSAAPAVTETAAAQSSANAQVRGFNPSDLASPMVDMIVDELIFDASAKVVQTGSDTLGTLLDIKT